MEQQAEQQRALTAYHRACIEGDLKEVKAWIQFYPYFVRYYFPFQVACREGNLEIAQLLYGHNPKLYLTSGLVEYICSGRESIKPPVKNSNNLLATLQWLVRKMDFPKYTIENCIVVLVKQGCYNIAQWFLTLLKGKCEFDIYKLSLDRFFHYSCRHCKLDMIMWAINQVPAYHYTIHFMEENGQVYDVIYNINSPEEIRELKWEARKELVKVMEADSNSKLDILPPDAIRLICTFV
jgi:hypothetical protein